MFEILAYFKECSFPAGVSVSGVALILSLLVYFMVSRLTRHGPGAAIDPDVRMVMDV
ncbi:MAG: hypothetical protein M3R07_02480 [Gemmatimonadota bacterium]|nr:hypothetical protein [Gemmatimonadota bacterium]